MARYVAFLRGVSPLNARMPELKRAFEAAGFSDVQTVLGSGNVVFSAASAPIATLERRAERAMAQTLQHGFPAIVRSASALRRLLDAEPYAALDLPARAKRVITFLRQSPGARGITLPVALDGACIAMLEGDDLYSYYVPGLRGPVFMALIEKTFGKDLTTRTWETVIKCVAAAERR